MATNTQRSAENGKTTLSRKGFLWLLVVGTAALAGCRPSPDDQRKIDLDATATAASGKPVTNEKLGKFGPETIRTLAQAVGIISVTGPERQSAKGDTGTCWYVQLPDGRQGSRVVSAAHVFLNKDAGTDPATATFIAVNQPINPQATVLEFAGPVPGQIAIPQGYTESLAHGKPDPRHDLGVFTLDAYNAPPFALGFDPAYQPQPGEQLLALGYPHELIGYYPDTQDIDSARTVMSVSLATVISINNDGILVQCEADTGQSGGPLIAERDGQYFAVGALTAKSELDAKQAYMTPLSDLPPLLT